MKRNYYTRFKTHPTTEPLVTLATVARHYNVTPAAASNWVVRYETFPEPAVIDSTGTFAMWKQSEIDTWFDSTLRENRKSLAKIGKTEK